MIIINCAKSEEFHGKTLVSIMKIPRELQKKVATEYFKSIGWPIPEDSISDELFSRLFVSDDPSCYSDHECKEIIWSLKAKVESVNANSKNNFSKISDYIARRMALLVNIYRDQTDVPNFKKLIVEFVMDILDKVDSDIGILKNIIGVLISKIISKSSLIKRDRDLDYGDAGVYIEGGDLFVDQWIMDELISNYGDVFNSLKAMIQNLYNQLDCVVISFNDDGYMCRTTEDELVFFDSKLVSALKNRGYTTVDALRDILSKMHSMARSFEMARVDKNYAFDISCIYEKLGININQIANSLIVDPRLDYMRKFISTSLAIPFESLFEVDESGIMDILGKDKYNKLIQEYNDRNVSVDNTSCPQADLIKEDINALVVNSEIVMGDNTAKNLRDNAEKTSVKRSFEDIVGSDLVDEGSLKKVKSNEVSLMSSNNANVNPGVIFNSFLKEKSDVEIRKFDNYIKQQGRAYNPCLSDGEFFPYVHLMRELYCKSSITLDVMKINGLEWTIDMMIEDDILTIDEFNEIDNPMGDIFGDYLFKMKELGGKLNMKIHEIRLMGLNWTINTLMEHNLLKK
jgi:hypothetical protein